MGEDEARVQGCSKFKDLLGAGSSVGSLTWCSPGFLRQSRYGQTSARLRVLSQVWQIYMSLIAISRFLREGIPWSIESLGSNMVCREKKTFIYSSMILMLFQDLSNKPPFSSWMGGFPSLPCLIRGFCSAVRKSWLRAMSLRPAISGVSVWWCALTQRYLFFKKSPLWPNYANICTFKMFKAGTADIPEI